MGILNGNQWDILHGDCFEIMKSLPDSSIDAIITDPPYHLTSIIKRFSKTNLSGKGTNEKRAKAGADSYARFSRGFMGQKWDGGDIAFRPDVWAECLRLFKPGGHLLAFGGTRTYHRMVCAIEDAGFEIRDCIAWVYGQGFPKSKKVALLIDKKLGCPNRGRAIPTASSYQATDREQKNKLTSNPEASGHYDARTTEGQQWEGWGTGLKPAMEPIVVAQKPREGTIADNVMKHGTGGFNIDGCRIGTEDVKINTWDDGAKPFGEGAGHKYSGRT